jgi:hypothetical protein
MFEKIDNYRFPQEQEQLRNASLNLETSTQSNQRAKP